MQKIIFLSLLCFLVLSCSESQKKITEPQIFVTLPPIKSITEEIVGNRAMVSSLISPGDNAHNFEPTPDKIKKLNTADLYFRMGEVFKFEAIILSKVGNKSLEIIDCSNGIKIINNDPHYWLSSENAKVIAQTITETVSQKYPQHKNYFKNNYIRFCNKIDSIDTSLKKIILSKKNKYLLVYHSAWKYFADQYHLEELSIEHGGKEPTAREIKDFLEKAKNTGASVIFFDPHFDENTVVTIAKSLNLSIDSINPLPSDYLNNLSEIAQKLEFYLK